MEGFLTFLGGAAVLYWLWMQYEASAAATQAQENERREAERQFRAHELAEAERRGAERAREERDREEEELHRETEEAEWARMIDEDRNEAIHRPDPLAPWMSVDVLRPLARSWSRIHDAATLYVARQMETSDVPIEHGPAMCAAAVKQAIERIRQFDPVEAKWIDLALTGALDREVSAAGFDGQWALNRLVDMVEGDWSLRHPDLAADPFREMRHFPPPRH